MKSRALFVSICIWLCSSMLSAQTVESYSRSIDSLRSKKSFTDALTKANDALIRFAGNLFLLKLKGSVLSDLERHADAIETFDAYLKKKPNDASVIALRGNSRYQLSDRDGALPDFNRSIQLDPSRPEAPENDKAPWIECLASWRVCRKITSNL